METLLKIIGAAVLVAVFIVIIGLLLSFPTMLLWNWLVPIVFPGEVIAHHIGLLQAWGILVLSGLLFRSSSSSSSKS